MEVVRQKPPIVRRVLEVARKEQITLHLLRVILTGDAVIDFHMVTVGINNKLFIPPSGVKDVHFPEFIDGAWRSADASLIPSVRTYTLRSLDLERKEMAIDFAMHGDGVASRWAERSAAGDRIGVAMKGVSKSLFPDVRHYVLVADLSAVPVTSVILETLRPEATVEAIIEVPHESDIHPIPTSSKVKIQWIVNPDPGIGTQLVDAVRSLELPNVSRFAHVAAEFAIVRKLREYFRHESGWGLDEFHGFGYWSIGVAEEASATERHDESHS